MSSFDMTDVVDAVSAKADPEVVAGFMKKAEAVEKDKLKAEIKKYAEIIKSKGLPLDFEGAANGMAHDILPIYLQELMVVNYMIDLYLKQQSEPEPEPGPPPVRTQREADPNFSLDDVFKVIPAAEVDAVLLQLRGDGPLELKGGDVGYRLFARAVGRYQDKFSDLTLDELRSEFNKYVRLVKSKGLTDNDIRKMPDNEASELGLEGLGRKMIEIIWINHIVDLYLEKKAGGGSKRRKRTSIRKYTKRRRVKRKNTKRRRGKRKNTRRRNY